MKIDTKKTNEGLFLSFVYENGSGMSVSCTNEESTKFLEELKKALEVLASYKIS